MIDLKWENGVTTLVPSFLSEPSSSLQVTRACIEACMSSNVGQASPKICPSVRVGKIDVLFYEQSSVFNFDLLFFIWQVANNYIEGSESATIK